jgi:hypothetical protein
MEDDLHSWWVFAHLSYLCECIGGFLQQVAVALINKAVGLTNVSNVCFANMFFMDKHGGLIAERVVNSRTMWCFPSHKLDKITHQ